MDRTSNDIAVMMLKQMGAFSIKTSPAKVTIVKFLIQDRRTPYRTSGKVPETHLCF